MRKLSEIKGEDAMDVLADLIEPLSEFATDKTFIAMVRANKRMPAIQYALKTHKKALIRALAIIEGENPDDYNPSILKLPAMLVELFNDPELIALFPSAEPVTSSGSVTESIEDEETQEISCDTVKRNRKGSRKNLSSGHT